MNSFNRRNFLQLSSLSIASLASLSLLTPNRLLAQQSVLLSQENLQKLPTNSTMIHLLNRTSFGVTQDDIDLYQQLGYEGYIDYQLQADSIDDTEIEEFIDQRLLTINMSQIEIRQLIDNDELNQFAVADELKVATLLRAVYSKKQLLQVMVEFWNNHFSVFHFDGPISALKTAEDREVIRPLSLSSFSELLHADAKSPAMIYYLDTFSSNKEAPNENYARELMELHTLGVDGPYTHHDIDEVARCFTGWKLNRRTGSFRFSPADHDFDEKMVLNTLIPAGNGIEDGQQVLDILANNESTADFIARKLCIHFISDEPDKNIIESTSQVFKDSKGDIKQLVKHVLMSKDFQMSQDAKLKRPFHYVASALRTVKSGYQTRRVGRTINRLLESLGQSPFNWQTPDGYPDYASHWLSTSGLLLRWNFINLLSFNDIRGLEYTIEDIISLPYTAENIVNQFETNLIHRLFNPGDKDALINYLSVNEVSSEVPRIKIQSALAIVLSSAYFQLS